MFRLSGIFLLILCFALSASPLLAQDKLVVFGGYSYFRPPVTITEGCLNCLSSVVTLSTNNQSLNGWELSGTYRFLPFLGITADVSGHYASPFSGFSSNVHQQNYLFGPEVSLPRRVSPFAHVLFGGSHQSVSSSTGTAISIFSSNTSGFATAFGAGIDLKLVPHVWIRPIQLDYIVTRFNSTTQNQPRVSAGLVFHF